MSIVDKTYFTQTLLVGDINAIIPIGVVVVAAVIPTFFIIIAGDDSNERFFLIAAVLVVYVYGQTFMFGVDVFPVNVGDDHFRHRRCRLIGLCKRWEFM